jgi:hypothetical protein
VSSFNGCLCSQLASRVLATMKLLFGSFKIVIDAVEEAAGEDVGIQIKCNPKNRSFTMTTNRKNKAAADVVDLTTKGETTDNDKKDHKDESFSSAGINIPYYLFNKADTPTTKEEAVVGSNKSDSYSESDDEVEFLGCNKAKTNLSLAISLIPAQSMRVPLAFHRR